MTQRRSWTAEDDAVVLGCMPDYQRAARLLNRSAAAVKRRAASYPDRYGTSTIFDFDPDKRGKWPDRWTQQLKRQIVDALAQDWPQSVRHVFYLMTNPRLPVYVQKDHDGYRKVQRLVLNLRRTGKVPYHYITDASRVGYHVSTYRDAADFLARTASLYRFNLWATCPDHVEVWCESDSIAGVLHSTCRELAVSLYPARGFASATLPFEAAEAINAIGKPCTIYYVGDYDPAGVLIREKVEEELRKHVDMPLAVEWLAITEDQIVLHDLPTNFRKPGEKRRPDVKLTCEAEAMPAGMLRSLVRNAVESHLRPGAVQAAREAEQFERAVLAGLAASL